MAKHQYAVDRDLVKECLDFHYNASLTSRRRVQIQMDQFDEVTMIEANTNGKITRDWFCKGSPVFTYWMTREQRAPVIARFWKEGYSGLKIAQMLGFSANVIYSDVRKMKDAGFLPETREKVIPIIVKNQFQPNRKLVKAAEAHADNGRIPELDILINAENKKARRSSTHA